MAMTERKHIPGWDTSAKIGWVLVGLAGGLVGLLACFLVNRNTSRFKGSMLCCGLGILIGVFLSAMAFMLFGQALRNLISAAGLSQPAYVDYVPYGTLTSA